MNTENVIAIHPEDARVIYQVGRDFFNENTERGFKRTGIVGWIYNVPVLLRDDGARVKQASDIVAIAIKTPEREWQQEEYD